MEEICGVINKFGKVRNTIRHVAREVQGETTIGLFEMSRKMLNSIEQSKVSQLTLLFENFGHNNKPIITFNYNGFNCVISELIQFDYDDMVLEISPP
jgi:hypothetical protein